MDKDLKLLLRVLIDSGSMAVFPILPPGKRFIFLFFFFIASFYIKAQHFQEFQDSANIDHVFDQTSFLGGGAAFFDYDNDGDDDLYITAGNKRDHFYENNGDGTFTNKTIEAGFVITVLYYTTGVIAGDIDNDGFKDLFVTTWFSDFEPLTKNLLFRNNGDGTFNEIWAQQEEKDIVQTMGATFIDYDLDGLLDIYAVSYVDETNFIFDDNNNIIGFDHDCYQNTFYHNLGDGNFVEVSADLGLADTGCALAVTATDFDIDGNMDIYLANDFGEFIQPNRLFKNNLTGLKFTEVGSEYNADIGMYGMGIAVGDIDNDLDLDYYITNFGKNALLRNDGNNFTDIADVSEVGDEWIIEDSLYAIGWGTAFLDVDNDADLDLYVANGYVPSPSFIPSKIFMNDKLFLNEDGQQFTDVSLNFGIENKYTSRGLTYADYDNDGDLDILTVVENVPVNDMGWKTLLYNNRYGSEKNWFQITLEGTEVNRDAYGSKVYLFAGDKIFLHEISGGSSHGSQMSSRVHFGLADEIKIDSIHVLWTGGKRLQPLYDLDINQHIYVKEDTTIGNTITGIIEKNITKFGADIYPNPAGKEINVKISGCSTKCLVELDIYNMVGQLAGSYIFENSDGAARIGVESFIRGVYMIKIKAGGRYVVKKIILR